MDTTLERIMELARPSAPGRYRAYLERLDRETLSRMAMNLEEDGRKPASEPRELKRTLGRPTAAALRRFQQSPTNFAA